MSETESPINEIISVARVKLDFVKFVLNGNAAGLSITALKFSHFQLRLRQL